MTTFLILGGYGATGKLLAKHLLARTEVDLVLAGRHVQKARAYADELKTPRVTARQVDATDPASLERALQGVDLCLVAAPTTHHTGTAVRACLDANVDYLDVQFSAAKMHALRAAENEITRAGRCFVTEAGFHPGLPSAMVRYAASRLDRIESALTAGYLNMSNLPYTEAVDELMEAFIDYRAQVYRNGRWTKPGQFDTRRFDFGEEIGRRTCYSMFFEELQCLPSMFPSLTETGFYISGSNWLADVVITPIIFLGLKLSPKRGVRPLGKLMWWAMGRSGPPHLVSLIVDAQGQLNGRQARVQARIAHPDGYELTAVPVIAYLLQYLDGSARRPGLHMMGHLADPVRLFQDMEKMGVEVGISVR